MRQTLVILAVCALLVGALFTPDAPAASRSHLGVNQPLLVICVKYNDAATVRLATCTDWANLLSAETNTFYNRATFNQSNFVFDVPSDPGAPIDGWFDLGYGSADYGFFKTGQDAVNLADPFVDFSLYDRVLVITNWPGFGGQGGGPWWWRTTEGVEATVDGEGKRLMTMAIVNEWQATGNGYGGPGFDEAGSVAAHELGHQLGLPTHYADLVWSPGLTRDVISPWDIMGYSPTLNHFIGYAKAHRDWIAPARIQDVGPPVGSDIDVTVTLRPQETSAVAGTQLIRIPFTGGGGPFEGYLVENRQKINGDQNLPEAGVLISLIDEHPETILKTIALDDPSAPGDNNQLPLEVGEAFSDPSRNLTVTVLSQSGNNYSVRVQYLLPPAAKPDPMMIPWGAPPWETTDIWIDSEKNGWGTYRYTDGSGNPTGNGDDAWVDRNNRVYVRVRNIGPGMATNVRVQVYVNQPPGMGDAGPDWAYLGTILIPSLASGAVAENYVNWTPTVGAHTCIRAVIDDIAGELSTSNNKAQENVSAFDSTSNSPFKPFELKIRVFNPHDTETMPVRFHVRDVPRDWAVQVDPPQMTLKGGASDYVRFAVFPSGAPGGPTNDKYREGFLGRPKIEAQVPYADTYIPIGGVEAWTHLTYETRLTVGVQAGEGGLVACGKLVATKPSAPPVPAGATIAVEFTHASGQREVVFGRTGTDDSFCVRYFPKEPCDWQVQASYGGSNLYAPSESAVVPAPVPSGVVVPRSLVISPATVVGGNPASGKLGLSAPAPAGGLRVALSSSDTSVARVPASVTVPAGASGVSFPISTNKVDRPATIVVTASLNCGKLSAKLSVEPGAFAGLAPSWRSPTTFGSPWPGSFEPASDGLRRVSGTTLTLAGLDPTLFWAPPLP